MTEPRYPDSYDGQENYADEAGDVECPKCGGCGLAPEGWDCEYCDGYGYIEV